MLKVAKLHSDAIIPDRARVTDAGLDLYFLGWKENFSSAHLPPFGIRVARTGIAVEIPPGFFWWITNKGRANYLIGGGIVDEGYQGEFMVKLFNPTSYPLEFTYQQKFCQMILLQQFTQDLVEAPFGEIFPAQTPRGATGGIHG